MSQVFRTKFQKLLLISLFVLGLNSVWINVAFASGPGDLDTSFNGTGIVTTSVSSGDDGGFGVAVQTDDKIVVVGTSGSSTDFAVVRYKPDGNLDSGFNGTGIITTSVGNGAEVGFAVALQSDNKIVVAGTGNSNGTGTDIVVIRHHQDGGLDTGFNGTGVITTRIGSDFDVGRSVAIQPDGKIVVAGDTEVDSGLATDFAVVRYNQNGTLDTSFKGTGIVTTSVSNNDYGQTVLIQNDNKIVVAGTTLSEYVVLRYTTTGELDTDFNGTGIVTTSIGDSASATSAALQTDGKIVVVGTARTGANEYVALVRYNSDGSLDPTFNGAGIVTTDVSPGFDGASAITIQEDNKILAAGVSNRESNAGDFFLVRYNSDGSLDTAFGNNGIVTTPISDNRDEAHAVAVQKDGKIVVAGFENASENPTEVNIALARYIGNFSTYLPIILKE